MDDDERARREVYYQLYFYNTIGPERFFFNKKNAVANVFVPLLSHS